MKPHKHAELIKAWADGAEIEERVVQDNDGGWSEFDGNWMDDDLWEYRIKSEAHDGMNLRDYLVKGTMSDTLIHKLRSRALIRRQIPTRKSVQNNEPDRIADLLEEAADRIAELEHMNKNWQLSETMAYNRIAELEKALTEQRERTKTAFLHGLRNAYKKIGFDWKKEKYETK